MIKIFRFFIYSLIASFLFYGSSYAQLPPESAVDRATREVDRPMREEAEEKLMRAPAKPAEIEEEKEKKEPEGPKFFVKEIKLVGTESVSPDEFKPLIEKYENTDTSLEGLNILSREIEREYLRKGIIAACFLPPQDIKGGVITLQVVEARMGELQVADHSFFDKDRIYYYWDIKPGEVLRYDKMSRSVQLMNKNPDRDVNATLHAGKKPGTTDVLLDVKTQFPIHGFFSFDREGSVSTGRERTGFGIRDNNFLMVDDTLLAGYSYGQHFGGVYAYHSIPITNFGTSLMYGYSDSWSNPKKEFAVYGIRSRSQNYSFYAYQDIYKGADYMGEVSIGMDANDKRTITDEGTLTRDRFRILRAKSTLLHRYPGCITYFEPQISQGLNIFGARSKNPLSSRNGGADSTFTKLNLGIRHKRILPLNLQAGLNFKSQLAFEKLASQEELSLGGIDSVRGYPSQDYMADNGFITNFELLIPSFWIPDGVKIPYAPEPLKEEITGLVFVDYGYGERRAADKEQEKQHVNYLGIGTGLRIRLFNQALLRLEWGFPVGDKPLTEAANSRFHFSLNFEDQFPAEFERIKKMMEEERLKKQAWELLDDELNNPESPISKKLYGYLLLAERAQKEGNLEEAKDYYKKIKDMSESLFAQTENYLKKCKEQEIELEKSNKLAMKYYKEGDLEKAKELWQQVKEGAKVKPLTFDLGEK